jgi:hypothetical protein
MSNTDSLFLHCEKCGKRLMKNENHKLIFKFGLQKVTKKPVVFIEIEGSCSIKCLHKSCEHINIFNSEEE